MNINAIVLVAAFTWAAITTLYAVVELRHGHPLKPKQERYRYTSRSLNRELENRRLKWYEDSVDIELNEMAEQGWRAVSIDVNNRGTYHIIFEKYEAQGKEITDVSAS